MQLVGRVPVSSNERACLAARPFLFNASRARTAYPAPPESSAACQPVAP